MNIHRNRSHFPRYKPIMLPRSGLAIIVTLLAVVALYPRVFAQDLIRCYTPPDWQQEDVQWVRDVAPHNKIDDLIDTSADTTFDAIVNFNRCVEDADIQWLEGLSVTSTVQLKLQYLSSVAVAGVTKAELQTIAASPDVAFIEGQWAYQPDLDISLEAICVTAGSPDCTDNVDNLGFDGSGINIVIMDTGVDNDIHQAFPASHFVAGYDAINQTFVDPDDESTRGHGTASASVALGQATANTPRGVAPGAGLIDVRVFGGPGGAAAVSILDALQVVYNNRTAWGVDIINMSFSLRDNQNPPQPIPSDGTEAFSQLIDLAESMDIVVVASIGNYGPSNTVIAQPAAATRAITVAAFDDKNTAVWSDDTIPTFSARGPRDDDGDQDRLDELKPDVAAPGEAITVARFNTADDQRSAFGTSVAAPHVAGLAALIMQANPGMSAASIKDLIISTADPRGRTPSLSAIDPVWNDRTGWGFIDAFEAVSGAAGSTTAPADLTFPSHPANPIWNSSDIRTNPFPPKVAQQNTISVDIENRGPNPVLQARIHFGVHVFSASTPTFQNIATEIVNLPVGTTTVTTQWVPTHVSHQCLKVEIGYGPDTNPSNNEAQRNITVTQSPITFQVQNTYSDAPGLIRFVPTLQDTSKHWNVAIRPPSVTLAAEQCPVDIEVEMIPPGDAVVGDSQIVHIAAVIEDIETGELITLGGVSVLDRVQSKPLLPGWLCALIIALLLIAGAAFFIRRQRTAV